MKNVVFVLGAGCSAQAGAPLMSDFLKKAKALLDAKQVEDSREDFVRAFRCRDALKHAHSKFRFIDVQNIESVFSALEMGALIGSFPQHDPSEILKAIASLKVVIARTLESTFRVETSGGNLNVPVYTPFAVLLRDLQSHYSQDDGPSVISFNYDLGLDLALCHAHAPFDYCLDEEAQSCHGIPYLKLHGSLNWRFVEESNNIIWRDFPKMSRMPEFFIRNNQIHDPFESGEKPPVGKDQIMLVPPTLNKSAAHQTILPVWRRAAKILSEAENIFLLGYSAPPSDNFFGYLLSLGTVGNKTLERFEVYNPDGRVFTTVQSLLGPSALSVFFSERWTFEQAVKKLSNDFTSLVR